LHKAALFSAVRSRLLTTPTFHPTTPTLHAPHLDQSMHRSSRTNATAAATSAALDSRSVSQPGLGRAASTAAGGTAALSQRLVEPGSAPEEGEGAAPGPVNGGSGPVVVTSAGTLALCVPARCSLSD